MSDQHNELFTDTNIVAPLAPDRRHQRRHLTVLRVAKMRRAQGEEFCLVRNISAGGLMAQVYSPLSIGDLVTAEFKSGHSARGRIVWRRAELAGVQFDEIVDLATLLADEDHASATHRSRAPRMALDLPARIRVGAHYHPVILCDISQGGAKLRCDATDVLEQPLVLMIDGLPPITGSARWHMDDQLGVMFTAPIAFRDLALWVASLGEASDAMPQPASRAV